MKISYNNLIDNYTLVATSENANYPLTNVQDSRLSKVWRSLVITTTYITFDVGVGLTIQPTIGLVLNHNITASGTVKVEGSADNFATTAVSYTLTRLDQWTYCALFAPATGYRYWRFSFVDATNTDGYLKAGRLWLGTYITASTSIRNDFPEEYIDTTTQMTSMSGQQYADEGVLIRKYVLTYPRWDSTMKSTMLTFFNTVKSSKKFISILDSSNMDKWKPLYGYIQGNVTYTHIFNQAYSAQYTIQEAK